MSSLQIISWYLIFKKSAISNAEEMGLNPQKKQTL